MGKGKKNPPAGKGGKGGRKGIEETVRDVSRKKEEREYKKALKKVNGSGQCMKDTGRAHGGWGVGVDPYVIL